MDSMNEDFIDNIITNLKIISLVQINEKLSIRKGHLQIDISSNYQFIKRWLNRDSRDVILIYFKELIRNISLLFNKINTYSSFIWVITRLLTEMEKAKDGILNLKTTYSDDPMMVAKFENILIKFNELINNGKQKLNDTTEELPPVIKKISNK